MLHQYSAQTLHFLTNEPANLSSHLSIRACFFSERQIGDCTVFALPGIARDALQANAAVGLSNQIATKGRTHVPIRNSIIQFCCPHRIVDGARGEYGAEFLFRYNDRESADIFGGAIRGC